MNGIKRFLAQRRGGDDDDSDDEDDEPSTGTEPEESGGSDAEANQSASEEASDRGGSRGNDVSEDQPDEGPPQRALPPWPATSADDPKGVNDASAVQDGVFAPPPNISIETDHVNLEHRLPEPDVLVSLYSTVKEWMPRLRQGTGKEDPPELQEKDSEIVFPKELLLERLRRSRDAGYSCWHLVFFIGFVATLLCALLLGMSPDLKYARGGYQKDSVWEDASGVRTIGDIWAFLHSMAEGYISQGQNKESDFVAWFGQTGQMVELMMLTVKRGKTTACTNLYTAPSIFPTFHDNLCALPLDDGFDTSNYWKDWHKGSSSPSVSLDTIIWSLNGRTGGFAKYNDYFETDADSSLPIGDKVEVLLEFTDATDANTMVTPTATGSNSSPTVTMLAFDGATIPSAKAGVIPKDGAIEFGEQNFIQIETALSTSYCLLVDFRFVVDNTKSQVPILNADTTGASDTGLSIHNSNLYFYNPTKTDQGYSNFHAVADNNWYRLVFCREDGVRRDVYINGEKLPRTATTTPSTGDGTELNLAGDGYVLFGTTGGLTNNNAITVSTVALYSTQLTDWEIATLAGAGNETYAKEASCPYFAATAYSELYGANEAYSLVIPADVFETNGAPLVQEIFRMAERCEFLDFATRKVTLELLIMQGHRAPILTILNLSWDIDVDGMIEASYVVHTIDGSMSFSSGSGQMQYYVIILSIALSCIGIILFVWEGVILGFAANGIGFWKIVVFNWWTYHTLLTYSFAIYACKKVIDMEEDTRVMAASASETKKAFHYMYVLEEDSEEARSASAIAVFLSLTMVLKYISYRGYIAILVETMRRITEPMVHFIAIFLFVMVAFMMMFYITFGPRLSYVSTPVESVLTGLNAFFGDVAFDDYRQASSSGVLAMVAAWVLYWTFAIFVVVILMNFFVAIVMDGYVEVSSEKTFKRNLVWETKNQASSWLEYLGSHLTCQECITMLTVNPDLSKNETVSLFEIRSRTRLQLSRELRQTLLDVYDMTTDEGDVSQSTVNRIVAGPYRNPTHAGRLIYPSLRLMPAVLRSVASLTLPALMGLLGTCARLLPNRVRAAAAHTKPVRRRPSLVNFLDAEARSGNVNLDDVAQTL